MTLIQWGAFPTSTSHQTCFHAPTAYNRADQFLHGVSCSEKGRNRAGKQAAEGESRSLRPFGWRGSVREPFCPFLSQRSSSRLSHRDCQSLQWAGCLPAPTSDECFPHRRCNLVGEGTTKIPYELRDLKVSLLQVRSMGLNDKNRVNLNMNRAESSSKLQMTLPQLALEKSMRKLSSHSCHIPQQQSQCSCTSWAAPGSTGMGPWMVPVSCTAVCADTACVLHMFIGCRSEHPGFC